jgi:hypothetical protein
MTTTKIEIDPNYCQAEWDHAVDTAKANLVELLEKPLSCRLNADEIAMLLMNIDVVREEMRAWAADYAYQLRE